MKDFLFPKKLSECEASIGLLVIRIVFGAMLMMHGWAKLSHFSEIAPNFPVGGTIGFSLLVFAEFFCSMGVITGFLYRLALIPMIIAMGVAFFVAHRMNFTEGSAALLNLAAFIGLFLTGSGKFAVDRMIFK